MTDPIFPTTDDAPSARRTVLVTGASAGIGAALAREYASRGCDLVLVARRADLLGELAEELKREHGCRCIVAPADLADPATPAALEEAVRAAGLEIDVLVNNAGYAVPGALVSSPWATQRDSLQVMVVAVTELIHRFLPGMQARRTGRIVNIASVAGFTPGTAGHTLYGPVKAWMVRFSEGLAFECEGKGVHVTAVCPGLTLSEFHDVIGTREQANQQPAWLWMDAETVARQAVEASERGDIVYINGWINRAIAMLVTKLPRWLVYRLAKRRAAKVRNAE